MLAMSDPIRSDAVPDSRAKFSAFLNKPLNTWRPDASTVVKALLALGATSGTLMLTDEMFDPDTAAELQTFDARCEEARAAAAAAADPADPAEASDPAAGTAAGAGAGAGAASAALAMPALGSLQNMLLLVTKAAAKFGKVDGAGAFTPAAAQGLVRVCFRVALHHALMPVYRDISRAIGALVDVFLASA